MEPSYLKTFESGELDKKIDTAYKCLYNCRLCPRECEVDRMNGETGTCKTEREAMVSAYNAHFGEEAPLTGVNGSGTIFFTNCNLMCDFCQNFDISHDMRGSKVTDEELALIMLQLQKSGCHNINFVTPTHVIPQLLSALKKAIIGGLKIPLVYNSGGYDRVKSLTLLDGIIDIYMPDFKFWNSNIAARTCNAPDYPEVARSAIKEMHKQVGDLLVNKKGVAEKGLLIRHLVLPEKTAGTKEVMKFIADEISAMTYVNIMDQYYPAGKAYKHQEFKRRLSSDEYYDALMSAKEAGIKRTDYLK